MPTIFWPDDVRQAGFCYGWVNPAICVSGTLQVGTLEDAQEKLRQLSHVPQWEQLVKLCGSEPIILGTCEFSQTNGSRLPVLQLSMSEPVDNIFVYYYRHSPSTLRFYALETLGLDTANRADVASGSEYLKLSQHDFTEPRKRQVKSGLDDTVINQFNSALVPDGLLQNTRLHTRQNPLGFAWLTFLRLVNRRFSSPVSSISRLLACLCSVPIFPFRTSPRLKDISATIQQIDVRAEQGEFFVTEAVTVHRRSSTHISVHSARYTNFFNTVWLMLNDITIGLAFGSFLCENHLVLSRFLNRTVEDIFIIWVQRALVWLDSWPAGLKLNTELSRFYSHTFIGLVTAWGGLLLRFASCSPALIYIIGIVSCGGVTLAISVFIDLLAVLTAHIYICYAVSGAVYQRMLKTAGSLWNLFRGKRYNVLRNRTDSWEYDIDQLIFGTILFTLLAFLFPTVLAYYALFAMMRFGILILQACMETLLALLNHFPLFALMLRIKDPWRLPGGIYFSAINTPGLSHPQLVIKNQPVPFSTIFFQYIQLLSRLATHYNPLRLLRCIFSGQYLAAISRYSIRYNKIPEEHISII
ncbi:N-acetylglucosaminyl transferase component-domain-containing protein [Collybia nuda]|uniref:N-acetylglucosaminyl transferase component-domain-containing protein n=1 Tax=Collybia nuda TaxID=64659 RepID=A0A9P5YCG7_9AGAR|nr:N-acetylglucosaminyl transferase component-domain-containing protein [Collybia nuda]